MISYNLNYLLKALFPSSVTLRGRGARASTYESGSGVRGTQNSVRSKYLDIMGEGPSNTSNDNTDSCH